MSPSMNINKKLELCYEIIMQAARAKLLNARGVRTGYTHWLGPELKKEVRIFSGYVSQQAIENGTHIGLVLEHFLRIQTELTSLIAKHLETGENPEEFVKEVRRLEQVHIVTKDENTTLRRKDISGSYEKAGIELIHWSNVPPESIGFLKKKLQGAVANAQEFIG